MSCIEICGKSADKLQSKGFGVRRGNCLCLHHEEALYIAEKGIADLDFEEVFLKASKSGDFDVRFLVYRDLRSRGYVIKVKRDHFQARKSYSMKFYPINGSSRISHETLRARDLPHIMAVVDEEGDITYYLVDSADPAGEVRERVTIGEYKVAGSRVFLLKNFEHLGTFGKNEGVFAHLSNNEARYIIKDIPVEIDSDTYRVYQDLRDRGLIVKSGFKYGTHFRVYVKSLEEHSKYLVQVMKNAVHLEELSRGVRVAHGVRKELLLAGFDGDRVVYLSVSWIRP